MERWVEGWLGVEPCPIAVATATLRLPLERVDPPVGGLEAAVAAARRAWHDPDAIPEDPTGPRPPARPSGAKREMLDAIARAPRRTVERRAAFHGMHRRLEALRAARASAVEGAQRRAAEALRWRDEAEIAGRRDWPFALYPPEMIDALAAAVSASIVGASDAASLTARD
jgi:hypothetical protein